MAGTFASYPLSGGGGGSGWTKITYKLADFQAFGAVMDSGVINLMSVPLESSVMSICYNASIGLTGGSISGAQISLGNTFSGPIWYFNTGDITTTNSFLFLPSGGTALLGPIQTWVPANITVEFNTIGDTFNHLTAGQVDIYVQIQNMAGG